MNFTKDKSTSNGDGVHLLDLVVVLAKYSRMIIFATVAVTLLTYLILFIIPNKYTATARLLPPQQNMTLIAQLLEVMGGEVTPGKMGGLGAGLGSMTASFLGIRNAGDLYVSIMTGDTVADRIIDRFNLRKYYKEKYTEDMRKRLWLNVRISVGRKDGIIDIEVTDKDPKRAAAMANAFAEELDRSLKELSSNEAKDRLVFLEKERVQASQNLKKAEEALRAFAENKGVIQIDTQTRSALEYIARLKAEIDAKEVQLKVLRQQAASSNFDVIRLETELKGLRENLRSTDKLDQIVGADVLLTTSKVPALALEYLRLYREVKFQDAIHQLFCKLGELARIDMARDVALVNVVDRALPPEKRSNQRVLPSVIAGIITFFMMIVMAFILEYWQEAMTAENESRLASIKGYLEPWHRMFHRFLRPRSGKIVS